MTRIIKFAPQEFYHSYNRGTEKRDVFMSAKDYERFLALMYICNQSEEPVRIEKKTLSELVRICPKKDNELIEIAAYCLMPNHFHLLAKERQADGISRFMHRVSMAYSKYINEKYEESGALFQGAFKSRLVEEDADFRNLAVYVMVKNPFELYPGGLQRAIENFDDAYERTASDPLSSLGEYSGIRPSSIITKDLLGELFETPESFKDFARDTMLHRLDQLASEFESN